MLSRNVFLEKCEKLNELGYSSGYETGARLARGFADVGYEEYSLLTNDRLISLFTGELSNLPADHKDHFFFVPTCDEIVEEFYRRGFDVESVAFRDQREWSLSVKGGEECDAWRREFVSSTLIDVLVDGLVELLQVELTVEDEERAAR